MGLYNKLLVDEREEKKNLANNNAIERSIYIYGY